MRRIGIIIARGGSKRIHRKNIKSFSGKPIIAYPIKVALESGLFSEVMVSTDDEEIKSISESLGAAVPFLRSEKNADDYATSFDVVKEVLEQYEKKSECYDQACLIYPTAVFISVSLLKNILTLLDEGHFDSVFPVVPYNHPIQRSMILDDSGRVKYKYPENKLVRTQDLETSFHDSGQFYMFNVSKVLTNGQLITENSGGYPVSNIDFHDVDSLSDWEVAEFKYKFKHAQ